MERVNTSLPHLELMWLSSLWEFLASIDSFLAKVGEHRYTENLNGTIHDTRITNGILLLGRFTAPEIWRLNSWRPFLQAHQEETISDLVNISGTSFLDTKKYARQLLADCSVTHDVHINQQRRPSNSEWNLWRSLYQPLGPWLHPIKLEQQWHKAYHLNRRIWVLDNDQYVQCQLVDREGAVYHNHINAPCSWHDIAKNGSLPVDVITEMPTSSRVMQATKLLPLRLFHAATFDQYALTIAALWKAVFLLHMDLLLSWSFHCQCGPCSRYSIGY